MRKARASWFCNRTLATIAMSGSSHQGSKHKTAKARNARIAVLALQVRTLKKKTKVAQQECRQLVNAAETASRVLRKLVRQKCAFPGCTVRRSENVRLWQCGRCRTAYYCSKAHQTQHWHEHRAACQSCSPSSEPFEPHEAMRLAQ